MAAWMLYVTGFAAVISAAGFVGELGALQARWPTRFVWLAAMMLSIAPMAMLAIGIAGGVPAVGSAGVAGSGSEAALNRLLVVGWIASSVAFLAGLRLSAWTLRRRSAYWRQATMAGEVVLVSADTGPGVLGARRPRYVVPRRVLAWDERLQHMVVAHEREHVRTGDPWILLLALGLVATAPWCLPLWWQLHRLREAVEGDCDARVVAATGAARDYAGVVLALAGRRGRRPLMPMPALAPGVREVERRIRRIVGRRRSLARGMALSAAAGALAVVILAFAQRPQPPYFGLERAVVPAVAPGVVREPPSAFVILRLARPSAEPERP